jgi:thiol-disulfide isomerase/thioredoxin
MSRIDIHDLYGRAERAWSEGRFDEAREAYGRLLPAVADPRGQEYLRRKTLLLELLGRRAPVPQGLVPVTGEVPPLGGGKPLLLFFFQHNCLDCRSAAPMVASLARRHAPRGLRFLGVDVPLDAPESHTPEAVRAFAGDTGLPGPLALDLPGGPALRAYRSTETPYVAVVDGDGDLRYLDFPWPERLEERLDQMWGGGTAS